MTLVSKEAASPSKPVEECDKEIKAVFQLKYPQQTRVTELYRRCRQSQWPIEHCNPLCEIMHLHILASFMHTTVCTIRSLNKLNSTDVRHFLIICNTFLKCRLPNFRLLDKTVFQLTIYYVDNFSRAFLFAFHYSIFCLPILYTSPLCGSVA